MAIRVIVVGLGPIGERVLRQVIERPGYQAVAAVDLDDAKIGRDIGDLCGMDERHGVVVRGDLDGALADTGADVVALCTSSALASIVPDVEKITAAGLPIVSTTETLSYPWFADPELSRRIDQLARDAGVAIVGTGVNPGFAMDVVPILVTAACSRVDRIEVDRLQDAAPRRLPFQQKIGAGLEEDVFRDLVAQGKLGHVGLPESIAMIAAAMGWTLDRITDVVEPKIAEERLTSGMIPVEKGQAAGIIQDGIGYRDGEAVITLHMEAYIGAPETVDTVRIFGEPNMTSTIVGIQGDVATASVTVNAIPRVLGTRPGLNTMRDMPLVSWWGGGEKA
jgi:4-hydroxy-tetrahydrodipicolinate reductase